MSKKKKDWWKKAKESSQYKETIKRIGKSSKGRIKGGELHPSWKGGHFYLKGYVMIYAPHHPSATSRKYALEHRLVMEKHLGRFLRKGEDVHHINGVKDDNRIENLEIVNHLSHFKEYGCPKCGFKILLK